MKLGELIKKVGAGVIRAVVPNGGLLVDTINAVLPPNKKLPADATGQQVKDTLDALPVAQRVAIMNKELDVTAIDIQESNTTLRAMLESDAQNPHTTRPYIAKQSFHVLAFEVVMIITVWAYGVVTGDAEMVEAVMAGWPFVMAVSTPLVVMLQAYFGVLKKEQKNKLDAANGAAIPSGLTGLLAGLLERQSWRSKS